MKMIILSSLLALGLIFNWSVVHSNDLHGNEKEKPCECSGKIVGTRWCDNGDGTVTDMLGDRGNGKCLVWLKKADWGGQMGWRNDPLRLISVEHANSRARSLKSGEPGSGLSDGSVSNDWRLPSILELSALANGVEAVRFGNMRAFTGVQQGNYWSGSIHGGPGPCSGGKCAYVVSLINGYRYYAVGTEVQLFVWPVRKGR